MQRREFLKTALAFSVFPHAIENLSAQQPTSPTANSEMMVPSEPTPTQIEEIKKRLKLAYATDAGTLREDASFAALAESVHSRLTEALNKGRPENERVIIPKFGALFVFDSEQTNIFTLPVTDEKGNTSYELGRTSSLDTLLTKDEKSARGWPR